tara:strand:- start:8484 stop:9140 length:657 start_codon:yes stop_codon:yes gene_type:complete
MSSVGSKGVIIQDALGGDAVTVTDGKLDVNATLSANVTVALDSAGDSVECIQDTAADLNATIGNAIGNAVYTRLTNGTQVMPTMDVVGRPGFMKITDGLQFVNVTANNELEVSLNNIDGAAGTMITANARCTNATNTKVTIGASTTEIVNAFSGRFELTIVNDSDEVIYLGLNEDAVMNEGIRLNPNGGSFSTDVFTNPVDGICASGSKNVTVVEIHA